MNTVDPQPHIDSGAPLQDTSLDRVLFVNYAIENCGVYQYGLNLFHALKHSRRYQYHYLPVRSMADIVEAVCGGDYSAIIYNYHPQTLSFIDPRSPRRFLPVNIAVMHEMTEGEADKMPSRFFQYYTMGDPTLKEHNPRVFKTGRLIVPYVNRQTPPTVVTVGTFGFSVGSKGYSRVVETVQREFDTAIIRIHIPSNGIVDPRGNQAIKQIESCRETIRKPGVRLEVSNHFMSPSEVLDFLASNTINAFLYDYIKVAGISSSTDHAIAAQRPFVTSKSIMFRHLFDLDPPVTIEDLTMKQIIANGTAPHDHLRKLWSPENMVATYDRIVAAAILEDGRKQVAIALEPERRAIASLQKRVVSMKLPLLHVARGILTRTRRLVRVAKRNSWSRYQAFREQIRFNRILDDKAREKYRHSINRLHQLVPEMMRGKIPDANVQQGFMLDSVERFARNYNSPKILCVGSFEDTACASLIKLGYHIEQIDPVVNGVDLNDFFSLTTTTKASYDIIFSTSVIEHVRDDEQFISQIVALLAPGGVAVLTCDFQDQYRAGDPVIQGDFRFYSKNDLTNRILPLLNDCALVDAPQWDCPKPDFELGGFKYTFATLAFQKHTSLVFDVDWTGMTLEQQRRFYFENGFLLVPQVVAPDHLAAILREVDTHGLKGTTEHIWHAPSVPPLIENDTLLTVLRAVLGEDIRFFKGAFVETPTEPRGANATTRKALHADYGIGEQQGDFRNSCACWINVGIYLTSMTADHAPLWVVPRSHCFYNLTPCQDMEHLAPAARMVLAKAGDAVLFHSSTIHAGSHNFSDRARKAFFFSYRPRWAKPSGPVTEWPDAFVEAAPPKRQRLLRGLNQGMK
jgi:SAM-dependent methyltransferase